MNETEESKKLRERKERYISHALVEIRKVRWLPLGVQSAILLDISLDGFKVEFTYEYYAKVGEKYWITIPLAPLGIYSPSHLTCQTQCLWFDHKKYRIGGIFIKLDRTQNLIVEEIINSLKIKISGGL